MPERGTRRRRLDRRACALFRQEANLDANLLALCANVLVVQVVEAARRALPPARGAANGQAGVSADGEAACVDGACLGRAVKLELAVGDHGAGAPVAVAEDARVESAD